ncbi:molybdopterin-binding protein [Williamsia sterculiae]|uniref:Molybdopterin molybdenumtransferase n=1 Tax=Williamsia sterculiae TaxID=1344003 RepID=A0A1N7F6V9_9NOCA|nr:molybdopterin-binding protein [Williamsia sterculiae]SIR96060.1 Molybdopterin biosynthesis enzyme [Williamsia sterculiae]
MNSVPSPTVDVNAGGHRVAELTIADMRRVVSERIAPLRPQPVPTHAAMGAALAEPLRPQSVFPPADTSAMDGFAVSGPGPWHVLDGAVTAGSERPRPLADGTATVIATGALVPPMTSFVLRRENARQLWGGRLVDVAGRRPGIGNDIRRRGENWTLDCVLARAGTVVGPAVMSAALTAERTTLTVRGPLRAQVVITGDEISTADGLRPGQTRDSLGPVLPTWLRDIGYAQTATEYRSDREFRDDSIVASADAPVIFVVGGTGHGASDHLRSVLHRLGAEIIADRILCRPAGSQLLALLPDGRVIVGIPGNPLAAVTAIMTTGRAVAHSLLGISVAPVRGRLTAAVRSGTGPARIYPAVQRADGAWDIDPCTRTAHLAGLINRTALAVVEGSGPSPTAEIIRFHAM